MIRRNITDKIQRALDDTPVVFLGGARQTGKSTLAQAVVKTRDGAYLSLDDATTLAAAGADPQAFLAGLPAFAVIDEVQKASALFAAIKLQVDRDRRPGRLLLTGSADILTLPALARELAGRVEPMTLHPFSQGELEGYREGFIDALFSTAPLPADLGDPAADIPARVLAGGYPEPIQRAQPSRRAAWYEAYLTTILQRDLREIGDVDRLVELPRLLAMAAARSASLLNISELSRSLAMPRSTLDRYLALLEAACLLRRLPAWSGNLGKRLTRAPKLMLEDSGLAAHLLGLGGNGFDPDRFGPLLEAFVARELVRQSSWSELRVGIFHFRTSAGLEVDLLLEDPRGRLVAIEVKATQTLRDRDLRSLRSLGASLGSKFLRGVLLHLGPQRVDFGPNLHAMPLAALWRLAVANTLPAGSRRNGLVV